MSPCCRKHGGRAETHKLLSVVVGEELLQLQAPVVSSLEDAVLQQRLTHVAAPRVQIPRVVRRPGVHQDVQTVHAETPGERGGGRGGRGRGRGRGKRKKSRRKKKKRRKKMQRKRMKRRKKGRKEK